MTAKPGKKHCPSRICLERCSSPAKAGAQVGDDPALPHGRFPNWAPAFAGEAIQSDHTGRSMLVGGVLNQRGPCGVMKKQSSSRTPNLPGR